MIRNMAVVRVCSLFVLLVCINTVVGKPFGGDLLCDWLCEDYDDDDTSTSSSTASDDDYGLCSFCTTRRRTTTTTPMPTTAMGAPASPSGVSFLMQPNGQISMSNNGMGWVLQFVPNAPPSGSTSVTQVTTSVAQAAPATGSTADPGATTAGPGATTAAPGVTTAAPAATTAAAAK